MPENAILPAITPERGPHSDGQGRIHDITRPTGGTTAEASSTRGQVNHVGLLFIIRGKFSTDGTRRLAIRYHANRK